MKKILLILLLLPVIAKSQIDDLNKIFNASKGFNLRTQTNAGTPSGNSRYLFWNSDSNRVVVKTGASTFRGLLFNGEVPANTLSSTLASAHIFVGNGSNVATDVAASGDLTLANTGAFTLASVVSAGSCTNCNVTFDAKGRATTFSNGSGGGGTDANAWHKTGDAFGANSIFGTTDAFNISMYANNVEKGKIFSTGKFNWYDTVALGTTGTAGRLRFLKASDGSNGFQMALSTNDMVMNNASGVTQIQANGTNGLYVTTAANVVVMGTNSGGYGLKVNNGLNVDDQFISLGATLQAIQSGNFTFRYSANSSTALRRWDMTLTSNVVMWQPITANAGSEFAIADSTGANGKILRILGNSKAFIVNFLQAPPASYDLIVRGTTDSTFYKIPSSTFATGNIYNTNGVLTGARTITGAVNPITFTDITSFNIYSTDFTFAKTNGTSKYSGKIGISAANSWQFGYLKGGSISPVVTIDTNNNITLGAFQSVNIPLYATGYSLYASSGFQSAAGNFFKVRDISTNTTIDNTEYWVNIDATSGNVTITLPAASTCFGQSMGIQYQFRRVDASGNTITIQRAGSDTINGATSFTLTSQYDVKMLQCLSTTTWAVK